MPRENAPVLRVGEVVATLHRYRWRWMIPATAVFLAAVVYALIQPRMWVASQALLIRDEAIGGDTRPGRFSHLDEMQTVQETILELARSRTVVEGALRDIGPPSRCRHSATWPALADIEKTRRAITLTAPNGAEFGRTEVFYLKVKARDKKRAIRLAKAVFFQLDQRYRTVRDEKALGLVSELGKTVKLAETDLAVATERLTQIEKRAGTDLAEMRILNESSFGESNLRRTTVEVENELRQSRISQQANNELLKLLAAAAATPGSLVATPNRLLELQPALRRLKDGLIDAQLATSQLLGSKTLQHPDVVAAKDTEEAVRQHLHGELEIAIRGLQVEQRLGAARSATLEQKLDELRDRMNGLAENRAGYQNDLTEVEHRREILRNASRDLAEARATQAGAKSASLIQVLDEPQTGEFPLGPSRTTIALGGMLGGLFTGWGLVFLTVQPVPTEHPCRTPVIAVGTLQPVHASRGQRSLLGFFNGLSFRQTLSQLTGSLPSRN